MANDKERDRNENTNNKNHIIVKRHFQCSNCRNRIGELVIINNGDELLHLGGLLLKEAHGICIKCGVGFHYSLSEKKLQKLLQQVNNFRGNQL